VFGDRDILPLRRKGWRFAIGDRRLLTVVTNVVEGRACGRIALGDVPVLLVVDDS